MSENHEEQHEEQHEEEKSETEREDNDMSNSTEYENLEAALNAWSAFNKAPEVKDQIKAVVNRLSASLGEAVRWHKPATDPYIAVTFMGEPKKIGAYIHTGYIDHIIELPGSFVPDVSPNYWRTNLSTAGVQPGRLPKETVTEIKLCPVCSMVVPLYGECGCGWRPEEV